MSDLMCGMLTTASHDELLGIDRRIEFCHPLAWSLFPDHTDLTPLGPPAPECCDSGSSASEVIEVGEGAMRVHPDRCFDDLTCPRVAVGGSDRKARLTPLDPLDHREALGDGLRLLGAD